MEQEAHWGWSGFDGREGMGAERVKQRYRSSRRDVGLVSLSGLHLFTSRPQGEKFCRTRSADGGPRLLI
jgi:hypothetical protein